MKTADLYIRVSTDEQADTGYSQRSQDEMLRRYCELNNIRIRSVFFEDHSAKTFSRPEFGKLLLNLRKHKGMTDLLLFTKWDRFSRNTGDAYQMISTLYKLGVEPQAIEQPLNLEIPENKMMLAFYLAAPEVENDRRALNVFGGMRRAKKEGRWMGGAPIGYKNKITEDGRKYISIDEQRGPLMKWAFEQVAEGRFTTEDILRRVRAMGIECSKNNFWVALRNPVYCGNIKIAAYKNEEEQIVKGQHTPLISEALFYDVQDVLNGKKKQQRTKMSADERFPLRGFLICPKCSKMLTASSSRGRKLSYSYYHCTSACGIRFKAEDTNDMFVRELRKFTPHPAIEVLYKLVVKEVYQETNKGNKAEQQRIKTELRRLQERIEKARELLMADSIDAADYKTVKTKCEQEIVQLEAKWAEITRQQPDIEPLMTKAISLLGKMDLLYKQSDIIWKRDLIGSIFPEKLTFDGSTYRTTRLNEAVRLIYSMGEGLSEKEMGQFSDFSELSHKVIPIVHFSNLFLMDIRKLAALAA
jgi:DNA invertase Pin-like site-specific DNA recombinase